MCVRSPAGAHRHPGVAEAAVALPGRWWIFRPNGDVEDTETSILAGYGYASVVDPVVLAWRHDGVGPSAGLGGWPGGWGRRGPGSGRSWIMCGWRGRPSSRCMAGRVTGR